MKQSHAPFREETDLHQFGLPSGIRGLHQRKRYLERVPVAKCYPGEYSC